MVSSESELSFTLPAAIRAGSRCGPCRHGESRWHPDVGCPAIAIPSDVQVLLAEVRVLQLTLIQDQPGEGMINAGSYRSRYLLAGFRFARTL